MVIMLRHNGIASINAFKNCKDFLEGPSYGGRLAQYGVDDCRMETSTMTSEKFNKLFGQFAEEAQFQLWKGEAAAVRFVYACEYGTIWKFTPKEWWRLVTK